MKTEADADLPRSCQCDHFSIGEGLELFRREGSELAHLDVGNLGFGHTGELIGVEQVQDGVEL